MVLCEIEKRCNTYLSNAFDLFAGVSTGALIATTCCVPKEVGSTMPLYTMGDLLKIYVDEGPELLPNPSYIGLLFSQKFSNQGIYKLTEKYFSNYYISQAINDLIIPAVNCDGPLRTDYFTSYDARRSIDKDIRLVDVLMATSAAPLIFPPYKIKGLGCFLDGCMTTTNPGKQLKNISFKNMKPK
jgi:patatin-like phospholipase/acyl hydrolase